MAVQLCEKKCLIIVTALHTVNHNWQTVSIVTATIMSKRTIFLHIALLFFLGVTNRMASVENDYNL